MAGGTAVVTAVGAAVGGTLGASVSNAYVREDKSFRIELLRPGHGGVPVLVANGFLTEGDQEKWGGWKSIVDGRYPDSPVYRVRWGAKELKDFGVMGAGLIGKAGSTTAVKGAAASAHKAGAKFLAGPSHQRSLRPTSPRIPGTSRRAAPTRPASSSATSSPGPRQSPMCSSGTASALE